MTGLGIIVLIVLSTFSIIGLIMLMFDFDGDSLWPRIIGFFLVIICTGLLFIDKQSGMVVENVTEIIEIESYNGTEPFTLARRTVQLGVSYKDDDGNIKSSPLDVTSYVLNIANSKPVEMQTDTQIVYFADTSQFVPALVCKYKIIKKGNFWYEAKDTPIDDEVSWYIQLPLNSKILDIK